EGVEPGTQLAVRMGEAFPGLDVTDHFLCGVGHGPLAGEQVTQQIEHQSPPRELMDEATFFDAKSEGSIIVFTQILTNSGLVVNHRYAEGPESLGGANPRQLQQLGGLDRPGGQDQLPLGADLALACSVADLHPHCSFSFKNNAQYVSAMNHGEVLAGHGGMQEHLGGTLAA